MSRISVILFVIFSNYLVSQSGFSTLKHDFGELKKGDLRYVDITYTNKTDKKNFLLSIKKDRTLSVLTSGTTIDPDSSILIRVQYNPIKKGKFSIDVPIYLSNSQEPFLFTIKGDVKEIDNSDGLDCPSFNSKNIQEELSFNFTITVLDEETKEPIKEANVLMIKNGILFNELETNTKGKASDKLQIGLYFFVTKAEGYFTNEESHYLNKKNKELIVFLNKKELVKEEVVTSEIIESIVEEDKEVGKEDLKNKEIYYAPNNIVFLLDISSSMNQQGKLDLLKTSMIEMTKELRDVDKITIVAYATFSKVILNTTTGNNKQEIIDVIQNLKADGMTAGGEGMKLAYRLALKNYINEANNQVIMATDGDFNRGATNVDRLVKKNEKKGIKISVLGIKNKEIHAQDMVEISALGGGQYLYIDSYDVSKKILIEEMKRQSLREK